MKHLTAYLLPIFLFGISGASALSLRTHNILTGRDTLFAVLDSIETGELNDRIYKDGKQQLIYRSSAYVPYIINTVMHRLLPYPSYQWGHDFSVDNVFTQEYGRLLRYQDREIGRLWCSVEAVTDRAVAVEFGAVGSNLGYPKGFKVWSAITKDWTTVNVPWLCSIVGWIDNE